MSDREMTKKQSQHADQMQAAVEAAASNPEDIVSISKEQDKNEREKNENLDQLINEQVLRDKSPEAKKGRREMVIRAVYAEFIATTLFFTPIFCVLANGFTNNWAPEVTTLAAAFVTGLQGVGLSFAFASISGAVLNPAVAIALWATGKLSRRKVVLYVCAELLASVFAMVLVTFMFSGNLTPLYRFLALQPPANVNLGKLFATEFFLTFFLTYTIFSVAFEDAEAQKKENMSLKKISDAKGLTVYATSPSSKTGFAPFSIGFILFAISLTGGTSGGAFNPGRVFGPALFGGAWRYVYMYWLAEVLGACAAGLLVDSLHQFGLRDRTATKFEGAVDKLASLGGMSIRKNTLEDENVDNPMMDSYANSSSA
ncbi:aquaporin-like protein [Ochromonadaceae sp. CCMP2298]|nr:aquaporin-like protein [Ochromonadaceae sp. CCMP2298]|mmetsp:Transcript_18962/g.42213  ORF Transcript_18962/g.42213 Transcript_18962/m.42213 type:complete len:370 (-) Transcript_18962:304-1413(-)